MRRRLFVLIVAAIVGLGALVAFATPAFAHATLEDSSPKNGARLETSPREVTISFSESVEAAQGAVRVFNGEGDRFDKGRVSRRGDSTVVVPLAKLGDGGYVVTYRVVSADSHPVQGAFTFLVGDGAEVAAGRVESLLGERGGSKAVGELYAVSRSVAFGAMLLLLGGAAFLVLVWPDGRSVPAVRKAVWTGFAVFVVASVANLVLQALYVGGLGLGDAFSGDVISGALDSRFGHVYEARFALLLVAIPLLRVLLSGKPLPVWWQWVGLAVGGGIAATPGFAGHAAIGSHEPYALIADVVHVGAAALWIGGLVMLVFFVLPRRSDDLKALTRRFSEIAFWSVVALVSTGVFQGYRQVGSVDALTSTTYGKLLLIKTGVVAAMLFAAWNSRRVTNARWTPHTVGSIRLTVAVEVVLAVAVLSLTGLLVNAVPAKTLVAAPQSGSLIGRALLVDFTVSPGRKGVNEIHLYSLTKAGQPVDVAEMTLAFSLPGKGINKIPVELEVAGRGHYQSLSFNLPLTGRWRLDVVARTSDIDRETFEGTVEIK